MPVVKIVAPYPVHVSLNNGYTLTEYAPGEYYDVPNFAVVSMLARGWAEVVTPNAAVAKQKQSDDKPVDKAEEVPPVPLKGEDDGDTKRRKGK